MQPFTLASARVVARCDVDVRGRFEAGELVQVALDRGKRSKLAWMTREDLAEQGVAADAVDGVVNVTELPVIAALERMWVPVCGCCLDELLVRSGETPHAPTPAERAFDTSPMADNAVVNGPLIGCAIHGVSVARRVTPAIAETIAAGEANPPFRPVRVVAVAPRVENAYWYDEPSLRKLIGSGPDLADGTYRIESGPAAEYLRDAATVRVCRGCLDDWLARAAHHIQGESD